MGLFSRITRQAAARAALAAGLLLALPGFARAAEVAVLVDMRVGPYVEALAGFRQASTAEVRVFNRHEDGDPADERALVPAIRARHPDQVLAIGDEAVEVLLRELPDIPILFCMVLNPRAKLGPDRDNVAGVALNVDPEDQMQYVLRLIPGARRVGALYDPGESGGSVDRAQVWLKQNGRTLVAEPAKGAPSLAEQVRDVLNRSDVYWMLPDRTVKDPDVVRLLFFQSGPGGKPLIGLSEQYVKAGALFALTPEPKGMGRQAADMSNRALEGTPFRSLGIAYAERKFLSLSLNRKTAQALGIPIPREVLEEADRAY